MFIEVQRNTIKPAAYGEGAREWRYKTTRIRSAAIVRLEEIGPWCKRTYKDPENGPNCTIFLLDGQAVDAKETSDDVLRLIYKSEKSDNTSYSVTLEGAGFSTTTQSGR